MYKKLEVKIVILNSEKIKNKIANNPLSIQNFAQTPAVLFTNILSVILIERI